MMNLTLWQELMYWIGSFITFGAIFVGCVKVIVEVRFKVYAIKKWFTDVNNNLQRIIILLDKQNRKKK